MKKEEKRVFRWSAEKRPLSTANIDEFESKLEKMKVGDKIKEVPKGIYIFGTTGQFSGGWIGSSDIISVEKTNEEHLIFKTEGGTIWRAALAGHNLANEIGCAVPGSNACSAYNNRIKNAQ